MGNAVCEKHFSLFENREFGMFASLLREVLEENEVVDEDTEVKLTFVRSGNVLEGSISLLEDYIQKIIVHQGTGSVGAKKQKG